MTDVTIEDTLTFDLDLFTVPFEDTEFCNALPEKSDVDQCKLCVGFKSNNKEYTPMNTSTDAYNTIFYADKDSEKIAVTSESRLTGERATKLCILDLKNRLS